MKTAAIYARYSCDAQTEQSIEGQLHVCKEYAERNGIVILDTYIDRAMTGTNDNRPDFQRMIKDSAEKRWNFILVYKLDRFSRNKFESVINRKKLSDNGVKVLSAMENIPDTPEGIILESLLEGMNQYFSAELSQKVKRGMRETRLKGYYQGGGLPYGYRVEDRKIVVDEEQAENVRYMFEQFAKGVYVREIIEALTARGVTYHGKPFAKNTVYNILKNEKYCGVYYHGEERIDNMYPQIVPDEIFERVRNITESNKHGKRSVEVTLDIFEDYLARFPDDGLKDFSTIGLDGLPDYAVQEVPRDLFFVYKSSGVLVGDIFIGLALFFGVISVILCWYLTTASLKFKEKAFGVLRSVGAGERCVRQIALTEIAFLAVCIFLLALVLTAGLYFGFLNAPSAVWYVAANAPHPTRFIFTGWTVLILAVLSFGVPLPCSVVPLRKFLKKSIVENISGNIRAR